MNKIILKLAFRESGMFIVPVILLLIGYVLFKHNPLRYVDSIVTLFAVLLGSFLAWRSFADYGNVRAFLFSRSYSPERFFLVRWLFGLGTIITTGFILAAIIGFGIRQSVQELLFANGWFPMIRFEELHVLICYSFGSLLAYHTTLYFMLTNRFRPPVRLYGLALWLRRMLTVVLILYGVGIGGYIAILVHEISKGGLPLSEISNWFLFFGVPALLQILIAPWFGIYCYKNQEIES
ncbi:MAG: hypothetical protein LBP87_09630 [Planctomycetaceae bacterium]|jgi:hypothetical protein|nr:hypothetical protein [Planctomycetaceae bacterium]